MSRLVGTITAVALCALAATPGTAKSPRQQQLVGHYIAIQTSLADDHGNGVAHDAAQIADLSRDAVSEGVNSDVMAALARAALKVKSDDVGEARAAFEDLTRAMYSFVVASDQQDDVVLYTCGEDHKHWLQKKGGGPAKNPYRGPNKPACGEQTDNLDN